MNAAPQTPNIIRSQVFLALEEFVRNSGGSEATPVRTNPIYFPWNSPQDKQLRKIAAQLRYVYLPAQPDVPNLQSARGLNAVAEAILQSAKRDRFEAASRNELLPELHQRSLERASTALQEWPETEQLLTTAIRRMRAALSDANCKVRGFLLFCPRSLPAAESWIAQAVRLCGEELDQNLIVASSSRPSLDGIRLAEVRWQDYVADVETYFAGWEARDNRLDKVPPTDVKEKKKRSKKRLREEFLNFLRRLAGQPTRDTVVTEQPAPTAPLPEARPDALPTPPPLADVDPRWSALVARLSFPDTSRALTIFEEWAAHEIEEGPITPDQQALRGRNRFLTLLRELDKDAYATAAHDLDGADQLYKVNLVLCGGAHRDSLLAGVLLPFWRERLENPLFRELFFDCFGSTGDRQPLVQRFESRTQLSQHLRSHSDTLGGNGSPSGTSPVENARTKYREWVVAVGNELAAQAQSESTAPPNGAVVPPALESPKEFTWVLSAVQAVDDCDAGDCLELAQMLMSGLELFSDDGDTASLTPQLSTLTRKLIDSALARSQGAVRFEATLMRARKLATESRYIEAREALRILRRTHQDPFSAAALQTEEAYVLERRRDFIGASRAYLEALRQAERISADELSARAVLGQLRCDIAGGFMNSNMGASAAERFRLRAQGMVQIQQARAPEIESLSPDSKQRVFVSYRSPSRPLTNAIAAHLTGDKAFAWTDQRIRRCEDFSPAIHRELLNSSAMVIVLGPQYFDSAWCVHELHFALGQNDLRGVPLFWLWAVPRYWVSGERCTVAISQWKRAWLRDQRYPDHQKFHIEDRLDRLLSRGTCLSAKVLRFDPPTLTQPHGVFELEHPTALRDLLEPVDDALHGKKALI